MLKFKNDPVISTISLVIFLKDSLPENFSMFLSTINFDDTVDKELTEEIEGLKVMTYYLRLVLLDEVTGLIVSLEYNGNTSNKFDESHYFTSSVGHSDFIEPNFNESLKRGDEFKETKYALLTTQTYSPEDDWYVKCAITTLHILGVLNKGVKVEGRVVPIDEAFQSRLESLLVNANEGFNTKVIKSLAKTVAI